jgi:hypothetical protein
MSLGRFAREYSLSLVLAGMFLVAWLLQTAGGWQAFAAEQHAHGQPATSFGPDGYIWTWVEATFENWQSEFLQLFTFVALTVVLIHRESHESRDGQDRMQAQVEEILARLRAMEGQGPAPAPEPASREAAEPILSRGPWVLGYFAGVLLVGLVLNLLLVTALGG